MGHEAKLAAQIGQEPVVYIFDPDQERLFVGDESRESHLKVKESTGVKITPRTICGEIFVHRQSIQYNARGSHTLSIPARPSDILSKFLKRLPDLNGRSVTGDY